MALEAINKIQEAETTATNILNNAVESSRKILSESELKADKEFNNIIDEAKLKAIKLKEDAINSGNEDSKLAIDKGYEEIKEILNTSSEKFNLAVSLVIERIVKFNGNS